MQVHDIQKFYSAYDEYLKTVDELIELKYKLKHIQDIANVHLNNTIDNGLEQLDLNSIALEYDKHKFNSPDVKALLDKIDGLLFKDLDAGLKDTLEAIDLRIAVSHSPSYDRLCYNVDKLFFTLYVTFMHFATHKMFKIKIPVKQSAFTTIDNWDDEKSGLYVVKAYADDRLNERVIGCVFDETKVACIVKKYLLGEFDEELKTPCYLAWQFKERHLMNELYSAVTADCNSIYPQRYCSSAIESCIDDRNDFHTHNMHCNQACNA